MNLAPNAFRPQPSTQVDPRAAFSNVGAAKDPLGPLRALIGEWEGPGFNTIWRPFFAQKPDDKSHFLQLNKTRETMKFEEIIGNIPNRGLLQKDIDMFGVHYIQQVFDVNDPTVDPKKQPMLHFEPGIWVTVPSTTQPNVVPTVCRMASIPHGTTILAQGEVFQSQGPQFEPVNIDPFLIGQPGSFVEEKPKFVDILTMTNPTKFRSPETPLAVGITQNMVDDPNLILQRDIADQTILQTTTFDISSLTTKEIPGGGTTNTAFLAGSDKPNADAAQVTARFWIEHLRGNNGEEILQLQYTQTVILNFKGLSWPHVSVATLLKKPDPKES